MLYQLPTGGGKTVIFGFITSEAIRKGSYIFILVHRQELLQQTSSKLREFAVPHGLINPSYTPDLLAQVQVGTIEAFLNKMHLFPSPDLIIIDEAHHATAASWRRVLDYYPEALVLGVTATPVRSDGAGLGVAYGGIFDDLILGPQISELITGGYLVQPLTYAPKELPNLKSLRLSRGDFKTNDLEKAMIVPRLTGNAVAHYKEICPGVPAIAFCVSVRHAVLVAEQFKAAGFRAFPVDGKMDDDDRYDIIKGLGTGDVDVITSCDLVSEGTDVPAVGCAISLRPTHSLGLWLQQGGRALRKNPGKKYGYILDHSGNTLRHGLLDDDREWTLAGREKKKRGPNTAGRKLTQCESCKMYFLVSKCPGCNESHKYMSTDDQLSMVDAKHERAAAIAGAQTIEQLSAVGAALGYRPNWAHHIFNARLEKKIRG